MIKSRSNLLTAGILLWGMATVGAQAADSAASATEAPGLPPVQSRRGGGTPDFGGSASWRFVDHFGVRAGFNYFSYSSSGEKFLGEQIESVDIGGNVVGVAKIDTKLSLMSEPLGLDKNYPWKKSTFRITVGILFNQNEQTGVVTADPVFGQTFYRIGNSPYGYDSASIGDLNLKAEQQPVSPYISIGASYFFDKAKHWSLNGELGVVYTGTPDVTLTTGTPNSGVLADLNTEAQRMADGAWKFFPILRLGVNYCSDCFVLCSVFFSAPSGSPGGALVF